MTLKPCPFCGAGETRTRNNEHWTGMRSVVISAEVRHFCERGNGPPNGMVTIKGKTMEDAVARWNERVAS